MTWKCPKCGSQRLMVSVRAEARLTHYADGYFETEVEGDHEWDDESFMRCLACDHGDDAGAFEVTAEECDVE